MSTTSIVSSTVRTKQTETELSTIMSKQNIEDNGDKAVIRTPYAIAGSSYMMDDFSKINYVASFPTDISAQSASRHRSIIAPTKEFSFHSTTATDGHSQSEEEVFSEEYLFGQQKYNIWEIFNCLTITVHVIQPGDRGMDSGVLVIGSHFKFPVNVTPLMNEDNLWGCFYIFPELYADKFSPVVQIRNIQDVPELTGGVLTRDMVTACLTYLKRTPLLGDFVYIKLNLPSKHLMNIDVLQHYKYLVYLNLSSNLLTELKVLSYLPYLQFLSVAFNRLGTVLEYDTPQWFLTEVLYKYNSVKRIRDLSAFWSITILDLSHNNIKCITGLENLRYLRRLDLSFNHIQRLENLNHLRLLWLDVSYNNISSCDFGQDTGLWTLLHLEYLNLNENNLTSMKMFSFCTRLRELHARNNRLSMLLELAVYMRQMRRLVVLDLRANPICSSPGYKDVVINTFSMLLSLDAAELDPIEQRTRIMDMKPDVMMHATRRLLRLLYIEQLSKARVSSYIPPADTTDVPIVILVGYEGIGKGTLARRLASTCSSNIQLSYLHTTAPYHFNDHYKKITRSKFDDMLLAGDFLTYSELDGESYGLSRKEASVQGGRVRIVSMDLIGALMLKLRGYRPYLILATYTDRKAMFKNQQFRKAYRNISNRERMSMETPLMERSTLQVLLSGRIIITGIINEIILNLPDEKANSEFIIESECSLMMDSEARQAIKDYAKGINILALMNSSVTSLDEVCKHGFQDRFSMEEKSLYSLFKESQGTDEYTSFMNGQNQGSYQERTKKLSESRQSRSKHEKHSSMSQRKSVDFSRYASSNWKGLVVPDSSKSSKSVTFTSQDNDGDPTGMMIEPRTDKERKEDDTKGLRSISTKVPVYARGQARLDSHASIDDTDLWLAFLTETGYIECSDANQNRQSSEIVAQHIQAKIDDESIMHQMDDSLEVTMDNPDEAFIKVRRIIRNIVNSQTKLKPMFDIDFANLSDYPTVEKRLITIRNEIAPQQLFY